MDLRRSALPKDVDRPAVLLRLTKRVSPPTVETLRSQNQMSVFQIVHQPHRGVDRLDRLLKLALVDSVWKYQNPTALRVSALAPAAFPLVLIHRGRGQRSLPLGRTPRIPPPPLVAALSKKRRHPLHMLSTYLPVTVYPPALEMNLKSTQQPIDRLLNVRRDEHPVSALDFHQDVECGRSLAFEHSLLRSPPARLDVP